MAELRIGQACALLVNSPPIAHIADDVGYANLANFNRQLPGVEEDDAARIPAEFCGALAMRLITAPRYAGIRTRFSVILRLDLA